MSNIIEKIHIFINPFIYILFFWYTCYILSVIIKGIKNSQTLYAKYEIVKQVLKTYAINLIIIDIAFVLSRPEYNSDLIEILWNPPLILGYDVIQTNIQYLDEIFTKALNIGSYLDQKSNIEYNLFYKSGYYFVKIQAYLFGFAITAYPVILLLISKLSLFILFFVAPFLISYNIYKPSKRLLNGLYELIYNFSMMALTTSLAVQTVVILTK